MKELIKLNFKLGQGEKILAYDKKDNVLYFLIYSLLFLCSIALPIPMFILPFLEIGMSKSFAYIPIGAMLLIFTIAVLIIRKNQKKRLYLTNKRFIVLENNKIESIEFARFKKFSDAKNYFLIHTKDNKSYNFVLSEMEDIIKTFTKIYPYKYEYTNINQTLMFLFLNLVALGFACNIFYDNYTNYKRKSPACPFKTPEQYRYYVKDTVIKNWEPPKTQPQGTKILLRVFVKEDGTMSTALMTKTPDGKTISDNIKSLEKKKLYCPVPYFINQNTFYVDFYYNY